MKCFKEYCVACSFYCVADLDEICMLTSNLVSANTPKCEDFELDVIFEYLDEI